MATLGVNLAWIAARFRNDGKYKYAVTRQQVPVDFWVPGEPMQGQGECVMMSALDLGGHFLAAGCNEPQSFVCEVKGN